ncbi:MAG: GAF domain-containing protein [Legionella sp.]
MILEESSEMEHILLSIIDTAIAISEADFGNIQLIDSATQDLKIVEQRVFPQYWLDYWENVSKGHGSCGTALNAGTRVVIEDLCQSLIFHGESLNVQLKAVIRAVQSTPLVSRSGTLLVMFSTHYKAPIKLDSRTLQLLDLLARQAADSIEQVMLQQKLAIQEEELRRALSIREEFFDVISHEFNTPLTSIKIATHNGQKLMEQGALTEDKLTKLFTIWLDQL